MNNKLTDDVLEYVLAVVEDRYDNRKSNAGEDDRIILALRELQERRKADSENLVKDRQRVIDGLCSVGETVWGIEEYMKKWDARYLPKTSSPAPLQGSQPVSDRDELPCAQVKAVADLYALCWQSGEVVTYTPDSEKAAIWLNNYSGTCVHEYVKLEQFQGVELVL